ncbi:MAG: hypothetical protein KA746_11675 [Pyrinomonadaceae bacterium]|nr:hypothetical protein [Pyrinomonadaceae bacterium]
MKIHTRHGRHLSVQTLTVIMIATVLSATSGFAQTAPKVFAVELVVTKDKKSVETDADLTFSETSFKIVPDKTSFSGSTVEINYADVKSADHSYSKKPMLSIGGAVATAILIGAIFAVPFLFIKKKKHWMTVRSDDKYAVIKLGDRNFRQIVAEFETRGVKVADLKEADK